MTESCFGLRPFLCQALEMSSLTTSYRKGIGHDEFLWVSYQTLVMYQASVSATKPCLFNIKGFYVRQEVTAEAKES